MDETKQILLIAIPIGSACAASLFGGFVGWFEWEIVGALWLSVFVGGLVTVGIGSWIGSG